MFSTGATGLEPATSGVTGRSWRLRADRGSAGIPGARRCFRPLRCGDSRVPAAVTGDLLRDERGMRRCLNSERDEIRAGAVVVGGDLRTQQSQWRWLITAMNVSRCTVRCGQAHSTVPRAESSRSTASPTGRERRLQRRTRNRIGADAEVWLTEDYLEAVCDLAATSAFRSARTLRPRLPRCCAGGCVCCSRAPSSSAGQCPTGARCRVPEMRAGLER